MRFNRWLTDLHWKNRLNQRGVQSVQDYIVCSTGGIILWIRSYKWKYQIVSDICAECLKMKFSVHLKPLIKLLYDISGFLILLNLSFLMLEIGNRSQRKREMISILKDEIFFWYHLGHL